MLASNPSMQNGQPILDIAIAGGGPAGAAAAAFLARSGYRVGLVSLPAVRSRIEGMSPRVKAILEANNLPLHGVENASQRHVSWGSFQGAQNVEHLVSRAVFDQGLVDQARAEGVTVWTGAIASVTLKDGVIRLNDGRRMTARLLFEARGRKAPVQPGTDLKRIQRMGPNTVSISGFALQAATAPSDLRFDGCCSGSRITARTGGWIWQARLMNGQIWQQVVTDASIRCSSRSSHKRLMALWAHGSGLSPDSLPANPVVSACALRLNSAELDPRCPRLGDAAVALDPLSGHGMFWAISSALMAPLLARAIFEGKVEMARAFYSHRVVDTFWRQARVGRDFHIAAGCNGTFWTPRRHWPDLEPSHPQITHPYRARHVISQNGRLTWGEVLITPFEPGGAAFVMGQPLGPILDAIGPHPLPPYHDFQQQIVPHLTPSLAAGVHDWLTTRGLGNGPALHAQLPEEENPKCDTKPAA